MTERTPSDSPDDNPFASAPAADDLAQPAFPASDPLGEHPNDLEDLLLDDDGEFEGHPIPTGV